MFTFHHPQWGQNRVFRMYSSVCMYHLSANAHDYPLVRLRCTLGSQPATLSVNLTTVSSCIHITLWMCVCVCPSLPVDLIDMPHVCSHVRISNPLSDLDPVIGPPSGGGMIRLETLIELKFLNSSFSSLSSCWNQTNCSPSSDSRRQYLNQQYH